MDVTLRYCECKHKLETDACIARRYTNIHKHPWTQMHREELKFLSTCSSSKNHLPQIISMQICHRVKFSSWIKSKTYLVKNEFPRSSPHRHRQPTFPQSCTADKYSFLYLQKLQKKSCDWQNGKVSPTKSPLKKHTNMLICKTHSLQISMSDNNCDSTCGSWESGNK